MDVIGTSKAKGTAGVVKLHGFGGGRASHGASRDLRKPGSIASGNTSPARYLNHSCPAINTISSPPHTLSC